MSGFDKAVEEWAAAQSLECRRLATELAARAYHLERGSAPVLLDDLVPGDLGAVLLDPSSGLPLRCRPEGDGRFSIERPG